MSHLFTIFAAWVSRDAPRNDCFSVLTRRYATTTRGVGAGDDDRGRERFWCTRCSHDFPVLLLRPGRRKVANVKFDRRSHEHGRRRYMNFENARLLGNTLGRDGAPLGAILGSCNVLVFNKLRVPIAVGNNQEGPRGISIFEVKSAQVSSKGVCCELSPRVR